ncbi:hypothetical protein [Kitasatospora sp. MBT63]|uniref:hypothetical protein n=1 Tax=Kitasatospora sp. MBT63 TaxID=1444768 RepID=UPI00068DE474|nr:hypothetical protein [Kitasatospora sp. MBT63]
MSGSYRAQAPYPQAAPAAPYGGGPVPGHPAGPQDPWAGQHQYRAQDPYQQPYDPYQGHPQAGGYDGHQGGYRTGQQQYQEPHPAYQPTQSFQQYPAEPAGDLYAEDPYAEDLYAEDLYDAEPFEAAPPAPVPPVSPAPAPLAAGRRAAVPEGAEDRSRGHRRKPKAKRRGGRATVGAAVVLAAAAGWFSVGPGRGLSTSMVSALDHPEPDQVTPRTDDPAAAAAANRTEAPVADRSTRSDTGLAAIAGLGPSWMAKIPAQTNQLVLVSGRGKDSPDSTVTIWTRTPGGGWKPGTSWPSHNALKGWTASHTEGDLHSPVGLFSLSDAGGRKPNPGSAMPYSEDANFVMGGKGFNGEPLAGSFDYVVAIDYNRVTGRSPLDTAKPEGKAKGGGVWLHLDHGGPTHGCVSLTEDHMVELIKTLDPAAHPMIAMGDADSLAV